MTSYLKESLIFWRHCVQQEVEKQLQQQQQKKQARKQASSGSGVRIT